MKKKSLINNYFLDELNDCSFGIDPKTFINKNVLITGSSGLLGTYFTAYFASLLLKGYKFKLYACSKNDFPKHLLNLKKIEGVNHLKIDLTKNNHYSKIPKNLDFIVHAAGYAQPSVFMENPEHTLITNILGASELLKKLKKKGSFLFLSSSEVYLGLSNKKCNENMIGTSNTLHERACYIEGKRATETLCHSYRRLGYRASAARLGDIFGPGTKFGDKRAINSFIQQAINSNKILLRDRGKAQRSYCYVVDALEILLKILTSSKETIYNVGSSNFISVKDMAKLISLETKSKLYIPKNSNSIKGAPKVLKIDLKKINNEFGKIKYLSIKNGLIRTINWQKENLYK